MVHLIYVDEYYYKIHMKEGGYIIRQNQLKRSLELE